MRAAVYRKAGGLQVVISMEKEKESAGLRCHYSKRCPCSSAVSADAARGLKVTRLAKNQTFLTEKKEQLRLTYYTEGLLLYMSVMYDFPWFTV